MSLSMQRLWPVVVLQMNGFVMQIYDHTLKHTGILLNTIAVDTRTNMQMDFVYL